MDNKIFVLYYGPSHEKEVSESTKDYYMDLYKDHSPILVKWIDLDIFKIMNDEYDLTNFLNFVKVHNGLIIIAAHGEYAEDGYIQEIFESQNIPFTGASSKTSKLCIDKNATQNLVKNIVNVPKSYIFDLQAFDFNDFTNKFGENYPIVLKPNKMGSSVYTFLIKNKEDLLTNIKNVQNKNLKDYEFIIQEYIQGTEYSVGVMLNDQEIPQVISITEIRPADEFFTYNSKYNDSNTTEITPAELEPSLKSLLEQHTIDIYNKIDPTNFYGRLDFIVRDSVPYFLEINTLPGFSKTSIVPQQLASRKLEDKFKINLLKYHN